MGFSASKVSFCRLYSSPVDKETFSDCTHALPCLALARTHRRVLAEEATAFVFVRIQLLIKEAAVWDWEQNLSLRISLASRWSPSYEWAPASLVPRLAVDFFHVHICLGCKKTDRLLLVTVASPFATFKLASLQSWASALPNGYPGSSPLVSKLRCERSCSYEDVWVLLTFRSGCG